MPLFRIENLTNHILQVPRLQMHAGECIAISGPSGAGKSLLLRALADLDAHGGKVWLEGREMSEFTPSQWRRQVGLLPAESQWWRDYVGDHFNDIDEAAWQQLGFEPETLQWEISRCSTGEKQRLALLRLLANQPKVLLLDEPTAALDPHSVKRVEALLDALRQEQHLAMLWVSHDSEQIRRVASRHLRIEEGCITELKT